MNNLKKIFYIGLYSLKEHLNSKILYFFISFSFLLIYFTIVIGLMAVDYEKKALIDFGLTIIELSSFLFSIFIASLTIQKEIETKTIYMVISRPVSRATYVLGKLLGIYFIMAFIIFILFSIDLSVLLLKGYYPDRLYFLSILFIYFKIMLISSIAMLLTSFTTSNLSSLLISLMIWILGHFTSEIKYITLKLTSFKLYLASLFIYSIPNFQLLNLKDSPSLSAFNFNSAFLYFALYMLVIIFLNVKALSRKEY
jgi:ABC-type transport system involved in multi-copper enzyme maturation permease subunit